MLSATVSEGNRAKRWNTTVRRGPAGPAGLPSTRTSPPLGASSPAAIIISVDLPQPEGPTTVTNSPLPMARSHGSSAATSPPCVRKVLETARISILGVTLNTLQTAVARSPIVHASALRMKTSPGCACRKAYSTRCTDSASDMRKRVIAGSVTVSGPPRRAWSTKRGMTEPRENMTLPYRTQETIVEASGLVREWAWATFSISALVMPIALTG